MKNFKKKNLVIVILFIVVIMMSVGFALITTTLNINGTSNIKGQEWDIHFANINVKDGSVQALNDATIANEDATFIEYEIELAKPGDYYEFEVDVVNGGTLDAQVSSLILNGIEGYEDYLLYEVKYADDNNISLNDKLNANTSKTYKVRVEYKKDINTPIENDTKLNLIFAVTYIQAD